MSGIKLYGFWRSSSTHRVQIALRLKTLDFVYQSIHLGRREQEEAAFTAINPAAQVPVLEHDGLRLTQSMAIPLCSSRNTGTDGLVRYGFVLSISEY